MDQPWLIEASKHLGVREIPGVNHHPLILRMWKTIRRGGIKTDEVPWCAAFVGFCLENAGIVSSRYESAASYLTWGIPLTSPVRGAVAVFSRIGGGHTGFITGIDHAGRLLVLGGNQGNEVSIRAFDPARLTGLRWPAAVPIPALEIAEGSAPAATVES